MCPSNNRSKTSIPRKCFNGQFSLGKYWNSTKRSDCPILDDSEGITLRSLGGVFICTLFGLLIAMVVLVIEVLNMKKAEKNKVQEITSSWKSM